jgi:hypothetical protein
MKSLAPSQLLRIPTRWPCIPLSADRLVAEGVAGTPKRALIAADGRFEKIRWLRSRPKAAI